MKGQLSLELMSATLGIILLVSLLSAAMHSISAGAEGRAEKLGLAGKLAVFDSCCNTAHFWYGAVEMKISSAGIELNKSGCLAESVEKTAQGIAISGEKRWF
ncbi:MAG: hypothetical protein V1911_02845 [Candidatus Micrarchaeota archaeon]